MKELDSKIYHQEEYLRRNFILIHVIAENKEKDAYQQTLDFINDNLDIKIDDIDIDISHRAGRHDKEN